MNTEQLRRVSGLGRAPHNPHRRPKHMYLYIPLKYRPRPYRKNPVRVIITSNCLQPVQNSFERVGAYISVGYRDMFIV